MKIGKIVLLCLCAGFMVSAVMVAPGFAALTVQMEVVSGKILSIQANKIVRLDDGKVYEPGKKIVNLAGVKAGDVITLKYFVKADARRVFVEYAPGRGSLPIPPRIEQPVPVPRY